MEDLKNVFDALLRDYGSVDVAEAEFKRLLADDPHLHGQYREWCHVYGHTERHGFLDYAEEYIANQNSVWEAFDDEYDS